MLIIKIVVKCLMEENGKVLLMREGSASSWRPGRWALPGGKVEEKETYEEAIEREMEEETGLQVDIKKLVEIEEIVAQVKDEQRLVHHYVFLTEKVSGELKQPDRTVEEFQWLSLEELAKMNIDEYAEFYYKDLFDRYFKKRINPDIPIRVWNTWTNNAFADWVKR